ncbi:MAG: LacI family DNA-binding transcriptional regulator, partial [Acidobacteriaceae bacterium]|nr:LacI family DNA-binding transcriptional regulator [Acidobacteriaceae bacterium]
MSGKPKPTIRDVARLAAVSTATVSAVINGTKNVSSKREKRVRDAMEVLDYYADQNARSLRTGQSRVIGAVIPDLTNTFYAEVLAGAEEAAAAAGYSFFLCNSNEEPAQERRHLDMLFSHRVEAVLIACCDSSTAYDRLLRRRFPLVFFDRIPHGSHATAVVTNNQAGGYAATQHLLKQGHEAIAIIVGSLDRSTHAHRLDGYRMAMQEAGLPIRSEYCGLGGLSIETAYGFTVDLFRSSKPPTAIFCSSNKLLLGCVRALGQLGLRCPEDVSIVGYDDFPWNESFHPPITTVAQPNREMGRK